MPCLCASVLSLIQTCIRITHDCVCAHRKLLGATTDKMQNMDLHRIQKMDQRKKFRPTDNSIVSPSLMREINKNIAKQRQMCKLGRTFFFIFIFFLFSDDKSEEEKNLPSQSLYQSINADQFMRNDGKFMVLKYSWRSRSDSFFTLLREKMRIKMLHGALDSLIPFVLRNCLWRVFMFSVIANVCVYV